MLFTRCPDCDTTFRVSDDTLAKANGQVRCGRCASVFNAYAELREPPVESPPRAPDTEATADDEPQASPPAHEEPESTDNVHASAQIAEASDVDGLSVEDVVAQLAVGAAEEAASDASLDADSDLDSASTITAAEVEEVLEALDTSAVTATSLKLGSVPVGLHRRPWTVATALAVAALAIQIVNHYRSDLVVQPAIGPPLAYAYAALGITVVPHWDLKQYQILDWVANAEPNAHGQGSLKISARIHNRGPRAQPYPSVRLRLKDRWEEAVGSRVFSPSVYLGDAALATKLMTPGETARAQLEVVDPGPDAYGFELDVCIEVETDVLSCGTDEVFL